MMFKKSYYSKKKRGMVGAQNHTERPCKPLPSQIEDYSKNEIQIKQRPDGCNWGSDLIE